MMKGIIMIDFTCDCGNSYNELTGDLGERICNDCLNVRLDSVRLVKVGDQWYNEDKPQDVPYGSLKSVLNQHGRKAEILRYDANGRETQVNIDDGLVFGSEKEFKIKESR